MFVCLNHVRRCLVTTWPQGVAGSGKDRKADFSSIMIDDSSTMVNFQDTHCHKVGAANNPKLAWHLSVVKSECSLRLFVLVGAQL